MPPWLKIQCMNWSRLPTRRRDSRTPVTRPTRSKTHLPRCVHTHRPIMLIFVSQGRWKTLFFHLRIGCISTMPCSHLMLFISPIFPTKLFISKNTPGYVSLVIHLDFTYILPWDFSTGIGSMSYFRGRPNLMKCLRGQYNYGGRIGQP